MQHAHEIVLYRLGILKSTMKFRYLIYFRYFIWYYLFDIFTLYEFILTTMNYLW